MRIGAGEYLIMIGGQVQRFTHLDDIPSEFEHVILFAPVIPPGPHTHEEHEAIDQLPGELRRLMEIENASSHKNR